MKKTILLFCVAALMFSCKPEQGAVGPVGQTGQAGIDGKNGANGPAGATGATGAVGAKGATGAQGLKGDPGKPNILTTGWQKLNLTKIDANTYGFDYTDAKLTDDVLQKSFITVYIRYTAYDSQVEEIIPMTFNKTESIDYLSSQPFDFRYNYKSLGKISFLAFLYSSSLTDAQKVKIIVDKNVQYNIVIIKP